FERTAAIDQFDVSKAAQERRVDLVRLCVVRTEGQFGRHSKQLPEAADDEGVDVEHVGGEEGGEAEWAVRHGSGLACKSAQWGSSAFSSPAVSRLTDASTSSICRTQPLSESAAISKLVCGLIRRYSRAKKSAIR